jgi:ferritin-like metal-binding protein YciE
MYDCEQKLVKKGLPTMVESSTSSELRSAFERHLTETQGHITRLERVFSILGTKADSKGNDILDELTSSAKDIVGDIDSSQLRDAALIVGGNKIDRSRNFTAADPK